MLNSPGQDEDRDGDWTWHSLRHVFCTTALFGCKLEATDVAQMAGHANSRITWDMYVGTTPGVLDRARKASDGHHPDNTQAAQDRPPAAPGGRPAASKPRGPRRQRAHLVPALNGPQRGRSVGEDAAACCQHADARGPR